MTASVSKFRRKANRCEAVKVEYGSDRAREQKRRSWRCQLVLGHEGPHESHSGHRTWLNEHQPDSTQPRLFT